ncbi:hypothetical protein ACFLQS_02390 [Actinomycetota bacterium]
MKIDKQKVKVKVATHSAIIIGYIHIIPGGRISDYITSRVNKFITLTEVDVYPTKNNVSEDININGRNDTIFINVESIEMMVPHDDRVSDKETVLTSNNFIAIENEYA